MAGAVAAACWREWQQLGWGECVGEERVDAQLGDAVDK
jgi:hypothetical protein